MHDTNLLFCRQSRFSTWRLLFFSLFLWSCVIALCLLAVALLSLALSSSLRLQFFEFLSNSKALVALSALIPLTVAGLLTLFLSGYPTRRYTFHSSLLQLDVDPKLIASSIAISWNQQHPSNPITCKAHVMGRNLTLSITASPPKEDQERNTAEQLHTFGMEQLQALLVAKHPVTFHVQWTDAIKNNAPLDETVDA